MLIEVTEPAILGILAGVGLGLAVYWALSVLGRRG